MSSFAHALIIGRFQPFHKGHLYLLQEALKQSEKISIAIGSANVHDAANPLTFDTRKKMLEKVIAHEGWQDRVAKIFPSNDYPSDEEWLQKVLEDAGEFDVAFGNNEWTNGLLAEAGYKILEVQMLQRQDYQGSVIRELNGIGGEWQKSIPAYLRKDVEAAMAQATTSAAR